VIEQASLNGGNALSMPKVKGITIYKLRSAVLEE
jgi:hypothetical protein